MQFFLYKSFSINLAEHTSEKNSLSDRFKYEAARKAIFYILDISTINYTLSTGTG